MNQKTHKILNAGLITVLSLGGLGALAVLINLNQTTLFIITAFKIWLVFCFFVILFYDLHFKNIRSWQLARANPENTGRFFKTIIQALFSRLRHFHSLHFLHLWLNYLLLPSFIFWSTAALIFANMGFYKFQAAIIFSSSLALVVNYWYLKEVFFRKKEKVDRDIFIRMSVVKIYASAIVYGASLVLVRRYCLDLELLALGVFSLTFFLIYQALFQHRMIAMKNLAVAMLISAVMAILAGAIMKFWGYNYFTAAAFMTVCYNLLWGVFHYHLDKSLTKAAFFEILAISLVLGYMVLSVTNFKAQILGACLY